MNGTSFGADSDTESSIYPWLDAKDWTYPRSRAALRSHARLSKTWKQHGKKATLKSESWNKTKRLQAIWVKLDELVLWVDCKMIKDDSRLSEWSVGEGFVFSKAREMSRDSSTSESGTLLPVGDHRTCEAKPSELDGRKCFQDEESLKQSWRHWKQSWNFVGCYYTTW